ncbi:MAG: hypothetical protein JSS37_12445 [Proteobacteria bacterium]|nr:hypothetical protein [Pseudomonadota bacterium]
MQLSIIVQLVTCMSAIAGIFFTRESGYAYLAVAAVCMTTLFSIALAVQDNREKVFSKHALTNLLRAAQPSEYVREAILSRIRTIASAEGLTINKTSQIGTDYCLEFWKEGNQTRSALLVVTLHDMSELSLQDEQDLNKHISSRLLDKWGTDNLDSDWNLIVDRIKDIANVVFMLHIQQPFSLKVWAQADKKYIAVGPPDCPNNTPPRERAEFSSTRLQELLATPPLYRNNAVALACEALLGKDRDT